MEKLVEVSEKEFLSFFNSVNAGILVHREGKVLYANRYLLDLYKVASLEDVRNEDALRFVSDEFREAFEANFNSIMKGKNIPLFIEKTFDAQGNVLWVEVSVSKVLFKGKVAALSIIRDVTERMKKEEQLSHVYKLDLIKNISALFKKEDVIKSIGMETYEYCKKNEIADYIYIASVRDDKIVIEWSHLEQAEIVRRELPKESSKGVLWYIADSGKKLYLPNVFDFDMEGYRTVRISNFSTENPVSYFGVPIKKANKVRMIVAFLKKGYASFSEIDFSFFEAIASQIEVAAEFDTIVNELRKERKKFRDLAMVDALTGVYTRHFFNEWIQNYYEIVKRKSEYASIVMIDIDHFKKINDVHGHLVGDEVLKAVGKILKENTRKMDLVVRYGGDEFLMIFPQTPQKRTNVILERIQSNLSLLKNEFGFEVTISYGISYLSPEIDYKRALKMSDERMYKMKKGKTQDEK